jgi:hypothetical protein
LHLALRYECDSELQDGTHFVAISHTIEFSLNVGSHTFLFGQIVGRIDSLASLCIHKLHRHIHTDTDTHTHITHTLTHTHTHRAERLLTEESSRTKERQKDDPLMGFVSNGHRSHCGMLLISHFFWW